MKLTAQEVYDRLVNVDKITETKGQIKFFLGDVDIVVHQKDVVGNIIQEWLEGWLKKNEIEYAVSENTQMPPDFYLDKDDRTVGLLEVKAFNRESNPGFDIADFRMYEREITEKPYMLNVDYLIFGYVMTEDGYVIIKDVWLKKVWEITRRMDDWALNLQIKRNVVQKIRPGVWYSERGYSMFRSMEDFVSAVEQTVWQNPDTRKDSATWAKTFKENYKKFYGKDLNIPRWSDIEATYAKVRRQDGTEILP